MNVLTLDFAGDPNIGLYGFSTESHCFIPKLKNWVEKTIIETLGVKTVKTTIAGTNILGIFAAGNSNGVILSNLARKSEMENLEKYVNVHVLEGKYNAVGNLILANDKGCIISDKIKKYSGEISDFLGVKTVAHNIGKLDIVGSFSIATNKGCAISKFTTPKDIEILEKTLGLKTGYATINFGSNFVRSGVIANSKGALIGTQTTSPEMQNIAEILGFF